MSFGRTAWLDAWEAQVRVATRASRCAAWRYLATGNDKDTARREAERMTILVEPTARAWLHRLISDPEPEPSIARRAELLLRQSDAARILSFRDLAMREASLLRLHADMRAGGNGTKLADSDLLGVLRFEEDRRERERAWRARGAPAAMLEPSMIELFKTRNEAASSLGIGNFHSFQLAQAEIDEQRLDALAQALESETRDAWRLVLEEHCETLGVSEPRPWDLQFDALGFSRQAGVHLDRPASLEFLSRALERMGLPLARLPIQLDTDDRAGKSAHAWTLPVDPPTDVRVLVPRIRGIHDWRQLFHEMGHAVYSASHEPTLSWVLRDAPCPHGHEGIAQLFASMAWSRSWLQGIVGMPAELVRRGAAFARFEALAEVRLGLALFHFEAEAYRAPGPKLTRFWWGLFERFLGVPFHEEIPTWARVMHFVRGAGSAATYLLADCAARQILDAMTRDLGGGTDHPEAGDWLARLLRSGAARRFRDLMLDASGEDVGPDALIRWLNGDRDLAPGE
ncbi:MAG: hypothetical protein HY698_03975 [Deltaproteobacteria bacterium]|nr:hypothetical protein [Deltaproteobacteria bacterium]